VAGGEKRFEFLEHMADVYIAAYGPISPLLPPQLNQIILSSFYFIKAIRVEISYLEFRA